MLKVVLGLGVAIALIIGLVVLVGNSLPKSTQGVRLVGDNKVRLPAGEKFALTHWVGKNHQEWEVTYDGVDSVRFNCTNACDDLDTVKLNGVNNIVDVGAGWGDHFYVWLRPDGAVNVKWPWGWDYREYKP